ncbi:hypothetical protein Q4595_25500, partial [Wenyingzhuangia sp. 1_MG-2023]|nr:hypothetical protein [Wenyingzhuangia sp. 1_MG-2023]
HRARLNTQITAGTFCCNNGVHLFGGTNNGVYRASLDTLGAADTFGFTNNRDGGQGFFSTVFGIQWFWLNTK